MKINNIEKIVFSAIDELNKQLSKEDRLEKSLETSLFGRNSKLDSLGLINLIVAVEQNIEDEFDITITLADERAMSEKHSPFRTVRSLADYIEVLLKEELND
jgi:D-alanine--poly(phosphoribitol) ligase subunit 2